MGGKSPAKAPPAERAEPGAPEVVEPTHSTRKGRVRVLPENGSARPFDFLFAEGAKDSAIIEGDAAKVLKSMPDGVVQTSITSPPYWSYDSGRFLDLLKPADAR